MSKLITILSVSFCAMVCFFPSNSYAAAFELILDWNEIQHTAGGVARYVYKVFYVSNTRRYVYICFATFEEQAGSVPSLHCGAKLPLDGWNLSSSPNVKTQMVGREFGYPGDEPNIPLGLWQIDQVTGDLQFCFAGPLTGHNNCVFINPPE
jgi:hypothetical protein